MSMAYKIAKEELMIIREFNAPKKLVFNAFATKEALTEWWGPVECKTTVLKLDFRQGGTFHYSMEKEGKVSYGRFIFGEIHPYDLLEFTNSFSDEHGNSIRAPFDIRLPLEVFYRLIFTEDNGKTILTMTGQPVDASPEEIATYKSIHANVQQGFGATFTQLSAYLSHIQNENHQR
jgi:uncharacterized protein YndB with AHSA1/START domain